LTSTASSHRRHDGAAVRARGDRARESAPVQIEPLDVTCPRCGAACAVRYYGPCDTCRAALRSTLGGAQRSVAAAAYEPKMNVTPNAIATKD
jgi:hypothetical protein